VAVEIIPKKPDGAKTPPSRRTQVAVEIMPVVCDSDGVLSSTVATQVEPTGALPLATTTTTTTSSSSSSFICSNLLNKKTHT